MTPDGMRDAAAATRELAAAQRELEEATRGRLVTELEAERTARRTPPPSQKLKDSDLRYAVAQLVALIHDAVSPMGGSEEEDDAWEK